MTDEMGPRAARAQQEYDQALRMNPFLDYITRNNCLARIAEAEWIDAHNGPAHGFVRPAPTYTLEDDFGSLPFRVLHWPEHGGIVKAVDFWTGNRAALFAAWATICERKVKVMHYPPYDPRGAMPQSPCWNAACVLAECLGVAHCDRAGNVWEQPPGTIWNDASRQWEPVDAQTRMEAP